MLRMDATAGEPIVPTAHPGIGLQRYDAEKVRRDFHDLMQNHGFEFRTAKLETPGPSIEVFRAKWNEVAGWRTSNEQRHYD